MLGLTAVIAIAACGAATFIVVSVVSVVVWVRYRKERHAIRLMGFTQRPRRTRGLQSSPGNTLSELSRIEGSMLRAHGQLPYGKPTEWGQLTSKENLHGPNNDSESSFQFTEKARSLRDSLSRSRSKRLSRSSHKRMSSLATLGELSESNHLPTPPPRAPMSISKEDVPLSAVEGVLELPAENTPRQTPDPNEEETGFHLGMKPVSPGWPLPVSEGLSVSDSLDSTTSNESPSRLRGGSIASQTAGTMPCHSVPPPPPTAYSLDRFSYARNDSVMRLSSMSLDTTNSSILDDGRNGPNSADTDLTSPSFPSGTFVPFSAADVGVKDGRRSFIATNTSIPPMHNFPVRSSSTTEHRHKSAYLPPRRSLTTHHFGASRNRFSGAPHRSGSMSSSHSRSPSRQVSSRSGTPVGHLGYQNPAPSDWRSSGSHKSSVLHANLFQSNTAYEYDQMEDDPFYVRSPEGGTLFHQVRSPGNAANTIKPPSPMQRASLKGHLPSALKGGNSQRKGHRRQNCVRISIHPPITFGSSTFSPTVEEEPEDFDKMDEVDLREISINNPPRFMPSLPPGTGSPLSSSRRSKYGSRHGKPGLGSLGPLVEEPQPPMYDDSPCKKKIRAPSGPAANRPAFENNRALPELFTSLPSSHGISLTHIPSPDRAPPVWNMSETPFSSHENSPAIGSPRRSAVKGPRSQPGVITARSKSTRVPSASSDAPESPLVSPNRLPLVMSITGTEGSDWRRSTDTLQRTKTDASNRSFRRDRDSVSSLDNGLGPIGGSSALYGSRRSSRVQDRVTIFEDSKRATSPPKTSVLSPIGSFRTPESSPTRRKTNGPRPMPNNQQLPSHMSSYHAPPTPTSPRRGMTTPTGKGLELGIGTATPASLYDGDGFLRE
ncbi:uncharacterized protein N7479_005540 [Penicillium vulpinum]|uniref:Uncharacterized protein n=1 Tax=Penicillium vulpinum TaxID=29845 RepID=A0A1V6SFH4_9EURO|nr:uncharacterized protein N7479_005540 [Penicillium vulpinum]KAJ5958390.1 hypothetical protein N7479_005540 [Penicillium vulpinum]OQE12686.1 hypothetical protein PENVUL_c001G00470 [Penicillium vulpinum]